MCEHTIAIIDDDKLVLSTIGKGLRNAGFRTSEYSSGKDALLAFENNPPDLAVVDIRMPEMDGVELSVRLNQLGIPFIILSAYGDEEYVSDTQSLGSLTYLIKPIDIEQIIPVVSTAVQRSRDIQGLKNKEANLEKALDSDRTISVAVGILMERYTLDQDQAFETLRKTSRSQRRKLVEVCREIVNSVESLEFPPNLKN